MHQKRTSKRTMSGTWRAASKVYVNQESHLRPLASETTSQSKILRLAVERFVSHTHKEMDNLDNIHRNTCGDIMVSIKPVEEW